MGIFGTAMEDWGNFYMLIGSTAGTLIGLIFVVVTLGIEHRQAGDSVRTRLFVTPILVNFTNLLLISLVMVGPISSPLRALALALIGCAGLAYATNLAFTSRSKNDTEERELIWDVLLPIAGYMLVTIAAASWALGASFANAAGAVAVVVLLITAIRNSWMTTLAIAGWKSR